MEKTGNKHISFLHSTLYNIISALQCKVKKVNRAIWGVIFNSFRDNFLEIVVFEQTPVVGENIHGIKINSRCKCPYLG